MYAGITIWWTAYPPPDEGTRNADSTGQV